MCRVFEAAIASLLFAGDFDASRLRAIRERGLLSRRPRHECDSIDFTDRSLRQDPMNAARRQASRQADS